ncbi:hypothetical protein BDK51DRAFT_42721 [Blyttiomyces helicus]|uniref:Uncharacterized protein n=1 Tax=Blyttiomyces helicus TaxID=388810 RepID=A0A4P9WLV8_9FUNG|nr:hypothetical protein BDK51DRAFT_42721 [Blyttiomyces helicus]|eukprot:RKO91656.1 hypothetical protein BDK51DRAFT_42721 [Blyttiomyces helicus]
MSDNQKQKISKFHRPSSFPSRHINTNILLNMADSDVLPDLAALSTSLEASVSNLEDIVAPLLSEPFESHLGPLPPLDRAKLEIVTAFAINTLVHGVCRRSGRGLE